MTDLEYLADAFVLIGHSAEEDPSAVDALRAFEVMHQTKLPAALFEFYSQKNITHLFRKYSNTDQLIPINELGWFETLNRHHDLLVFIIENQGVCFWALQLDGSDDPAVFVRYDEPDEKWRKCTDKFSEFLLMWFLEFLPFVNKWFSASYSGDIDTTFLIEELAPRYKHVMSRPRFPRADSDSVEYSFWSTNVKQIYVWVNARTTLIRFYGSAESEFSQILRECSELLKLELPTLVRPLRNGHQITWVFSRA